MILNNLQKTKETTQKSKDSEKVPRKILGHVPSWAKCNGTCTQKSKYCNLPKNARFLGQCTTFFQMYSFDSSDNNFEDYSPKKVQESFRKGTQGHPSYF